MIEGTLKVTPEKLISTADGFNSVSAQVKGITDDMLGTAEKLHSKWEGEASNAFYSKFTSLKDDMDRMHRMIAEHVQDLNEMAEQYKRAEQANAELSNALAGDVIE